MGALLALLTTGACGAGSPEAGTLHLGVAQAPESLDPRFATSAVASRLAQLVVAPLCVIADDLRPRPLLAERIETSDDGLLVDVSLRAGLRFQDGHPVRADDVVFTWDSMLRGDPSPGGAPSPHRGRLDMIAALEATDDLTVRFTLKRPHAPFVADVLCAFGPVSKRSCQKQDCRMAPVGAGPFSVEHGPDAQERILLSPWSGFAAAGRVPGRQLEVRVVRDATSRLLELRSGRLDLVVGDIAPWDVSMLASGGVDPDPLGLVRSPRAVGADPALRVHQRPGLGVAYLGLNVRGVSGAEAAGGQRMRTQRALADPRVRRALAQSLDLDAIIHGRLKGRARRASSLLPDGHWAHDSNLLPLPQDLAAAARAFDDAGFPRDEHGHRFPLTLLTTPDRLRQSVAVAVAEQLRAVGIEVTVRVRDWSVLYDDIQHGAFDAFIAKWTPVVEPDLLRWVFHSGNIPRPGKGGANRGGYTDVVIDAWLDTARAGDEKSRRILYQAVEARLQQEMPLVPLWVEDEIAVASARAADFVLVRTASLLPIADAAPFLAPAQESPR